MRRRLNDVIDMVVAALLAFSGVGEMLFGDKTDGLLLVQLMFLYLIAARLRDGSGR